MFEGTDSPGGRAGNQFFTYLPSQGINGASGGNPSGSNIGTWGGGSSGPFTFDFGAGGGSGSGGPVFGGKPLGGGPSGPIGGGGGGYQVPSSSTPQNFMSPYYQNIHGGQTIAPQYPGLSGTFASWLQNQIGQGVTPFNLSTPLPTGGKTAPGQLTASALPDLNTIASQGISALPQWQAAVAAMQDPIAQQTANLREQFGSMGALAGTPFGNAMSNFGQQTALQQESLLGNLTQQNILQGQIPVSEFLQGLNQQAIQNQYGEFVRTQPQYNPLIGDTLSMAQQYPPTIQQGSGMGSLGALLSGAGGLAGGLSSLLKLFGIGGGGGGGSAPPPIDTGGGGIGSGDWFGGSGFGSPYTGVQFPL